MLDVLNDRAIKPMRLNPHETVQRAAWLAALYDQPLVLMLCDPA